ncbi:MAG: phosphotransferase [candidate division Zixibacteria bacterium]|nr:phosphotransferase [candidate division Zixibacteria bacterium]
MDARTQELLDNNHEVIANTARDRYGLTGASVTRLGSFESAVYDIAHKDRRYILKATHGSHRKPEEIRAELDWVNFLAEREVPICRPLASRTGEFVETMQLDGQTDVSLILFEKAAGERLTPETCTDNLVRTWGECVGRMHAATVAYEPANGRRRFHWHEDDNLIIPDRVREKSPEVVPAIESLLQRLHALPTDRDSYGLVHLDLHHGNFFVHNENITVFDTDDCHYDWFANDLSMPLYYYFKAEAFGGKSPERARWFWRRLLEGYSRAYALDMTWMTCLPDFLKLREVLLYLIIVGRGLEDAGDFFRQFMIDRDRLIAENVPVIDLDFTQL